MLKIGIIGCGQIADGHVSEIKKIDKAEVVAVCDLYEIMAKQLAQRFNIPKYFTDSSEMIKKCKPDIIHVTTPPQTHLALGKIAMEAGCHVYIEKPFGLNYAQAKELIDIAEKNHVKITIGYTYYFDPPAEKMRELIRKGLLGEIIHIESFYGYDLSGSFGSVILSNPNHWVHSMPGKLFQNNINHAVTKITEFLDNERPEVYATAKKLRKKSNTGDIRDEMLDELRVLINGKKITGYLTFSSHIKPGGQFARIYGAQNSLHVDYVSRTVTFDQHPTLPTAIGRILPAFNSAVDFFKQGCSNIKHFIKSDFHFFAGLNRHLKSFYGCINHNTPPPISYNKILQDTYIMEQIFKQINSQRRTK